MAKEKKEKPEKNRPKREKPRLEFYMLAADNPIGKKQWRPIFRRKRSKEVLTREQVKAIKKGRRLLRKEMKAQGLKNRVDFEVTATNLGLYFDRNRFWFPIFLWFARSHTVAKILATTAILTTTVTVLEPVIRYVERIVIQTVIEYIKEEVEVDRFTISVDDKFNTGFVLSEEIGIDGTLIDPATSLQCRPAEGVGCMSIEDIPENVHLIDGSHHDIVGGKAVAGDVNPDDHIDNYFAYTFYAQYLIDDKAQIETGNLEMDYSWALNLTEETKDLSTATWIMVFEGDVQTTEATIDGKKVVVALMDAAGRPVVSNERLTFYAETTPEGTQQIIPTPGTMDKEGRLIGYVGVPLRGALLGLNQAAQYSVIQEGPYYSLYQTEPKQFVSEDTAAEGARNAVRPWNIHKYTVVIWLEGDDPQCTDEMMGGQIGMNFQIKITDERGLPAPEEEEE